MKPSQPNWFSHQPPRRVLSLQGPELHHSNRLGPPQHPAHPLGPIHSSEFVLGIPTNDGTPTNRPHHSPRDRLGPPQHSAQPLEPYCSSNLVPGCQSDIDTSVTRPKHSPSGISHYASPQFTKDLGNHNPSFQITRDHLTKPMVTLSYSGSKTVTAKSQGSKKARSSDERSSIPTVQLHVPPVTSSLYTGAVQEVNTKPHSDSGLWSPGNSYRPSLSTQSAAPCQDQQTRSSEMLIPAVDLNCSSRKRPREIEECDDNAKKLSLQCANSCRVQILKPSVSTSPVPSTRHSSVLELLPKNTEPHVEPEWRQSACLERSSKFKPVQSSCTSLSPNFCKKNQLPMGVKQAYIKSTKNHMVELKELESSSKPTEECLKKRNEENDKRNISSTLLSPEVPQRDTSSLPHDQLGSHHSGLRHCGTSVLPAKTLSRGNQLEESRIDSSTPKSASNPNSGSLSCHKVELNKTARPRRRKIKQDDIDVLFTPDPMTYVVSPAHKTAKPKMDGGTIKSPTSEKSCSASTVISSGTPVTGSSSHKIQVSTVGVSPHVCTRVSSSTHNPQSLMPAVTLKRIRLENLLPLCSKDKVLKNSPITSSGRQLKDESVKSGEKCTSLFPNNVTSETDTAASEQTPTSKCSRSPLSERRASEVARKQVTEEDSIDVELDLDLSFALDLDLTQSSHSSEEEQLLSLQEMMERVTKPPDTPEKGAFSEPSTPGHHSSQLKTQSLPSTTKPGLYKNNLDQMLKEINTNKKAKETERQLITACKEGLLTIAEYEEAEEKQEEGISAEQQEFLQRYSLMSNAIREVPPGEVVFNLEKFGRIFNQDTLELRQCMVTPVGTAQKTLLWSSPAQLRLHVNIGLLQEAYNCHSPCPSRVTRFLFKMMSVHSERMVSEKILQALCDIARTAAYQIVKNGSKQFKVWVPSLADLTLVLMNMGVAFVTLFPFENLQPPFTEGDLLEDIYIKSDSPSSKEEHGTFPEHNFNNILKYLSYCVGLCPRAYSDDELLLLLTMIGRVGLDTWLILESNVELSSLQYKVVNNIKDWDTMLPRICSALTDLTTDHHNMCLLVQLLPDNTRGKQLRRHLSMSMISKLIDGHCTYRPTEKEFQLSKLRPYLPCMQPSTLLRGMLNSSTRSQKDKENTATLDQQSYYLCYSLLTLANEASNFQFFPAHQKEQLLILCSELETHVKCDIRESEKCLYRSKVKDLVARIYTKWQILLQRTRPLNGKLYDYWQPRPVDTLISGQEEHDGNYSGDGEVSAMEEDEQEEETNETEGNKAVMIAEDKGGAEKQGMKPDEKIGEMRAEDPIDDESKTEEAKEAVPGDLAQELPEKEEKEPEVHKESQVMEEHIDAGKTECTEVETENLVETGQTSSHNQAAACDLMS